MHGNVIVVDEIGVAVEAVDEEGVVVVVVVVTIQSGRKMHMVDGNCGSGSGFGIGGGADDSPRKVEQGMCIAQQILVV